MDQGNTFNKMRAFAYCLPKAGMSEGDENKVCEMMANSATFNKKYFSKQEAKINSADQKIALYL